MPSVLCLKFSGFFDIENDYFKFRFIMLINYLKMFVTLELYTKFILVRLCRKFVAHRNTLESVPGTGYY